MLYSSIINDFVIHNFIKTGVTMENTMTKDVPLLIGLQKAKSSNTSSFYGLIILRIVFSRNAFAYRHDDADK